MFEELIKSRMITEGGKRVDSMTRMDELTFYFFSPLDLDGLKLGTVCTVDPFGHGAIIFRPGRGSQRCITLVNE